MSNLKYKVGDKVIYTNPDNKIEHPGVIRLVVHDQYLVDCDHRLYWTPEKNLRLEPKEPTVFQIGDIVEWGGVRGEVWDKNSDLYFPVLVSFDNGNKWGYRFTQDGRCQNWHTQPSLKLIERPQKEEVKPEKLKKKVKLYAHLIAYGTGPLHLEWTDSEQTLAGEDSKRVPLEDKEVEVEYDES